MVRICRAEDGEVFQVRGTLDTCSGICTDILQTTTVTRDIVRYTTKG